MIQRYVLNVACIKSPSLVYFGVEKAEFVEWN